MQYDPQDRATISVVIQGLKRYCFPRVLDMQQRVHSGELLSRFDICFLHELLEGSHLDRVLFYRHPELTPIFELFAEMVKDITEIALTNERR